MKSKISTLVGLATVFLSFSNCSITDASNIDTYKNLLMKNSYTIKYVVTTPTVRTTNRDKIPIYGKNTIAANQSSLLENKPSEGIVVSKGNNRYEEVGYNGFVMCRLQTGMKTYNYTKYKNQQKNIWSFIGSGKNKVSAITTNVVALKRLGTGFGNVDLTRALNALLPNEGKTSDQPNFHYVGEGWLDNGLNYVDYAYDGNLGFEAIRYYFDGYTLVKIALAQYFTNENGQVDGRRSIIKILEFSPTPDEAYLKLPKGVKDESKKNEENEE